MVARRPIDQSQWKWFGNAGHFICSPWCRFHLCTQVEEYLVSTVGEYVPDSEAREIFAECRNVKLKGRGEARLADYMQKIGFEDIGCGRKYETMVFVAGKPCDADGCNCGLPSITGSELDMAGYNDAGAATAGHLAMCKKWAQCGLLETLLTET